MRWSALCLVNEEGTIHPSSSEKPLHLNFNFVVNAESSYPLPHAYA